ncbi:MAG TPA: hypothetical protein VH796_08360 [Nitrososphaeraceae archaeon]
MTSTTQLSHKMMITAIALVSTLLLVSFALPAIQIVKAQYVSSGGPSASLEEQLKLAREKVQNAKQAGAYGSGTPMLGVNLNETEIYIIAIVIIFGAISAGFFYMGQRGPRKTEVKR